MIFGDASALISIIAGESGPDELAKRLSDTKRRFYSAMTLWETVAGLCRSYNLPSDVARTYSDDLLHLFGCELVEIGERESEMALQAYSMYGRGRHPAALNMGDCFSYACAKTNSARLLYKGNDFAQTDLA